MDYQRPPAPRRGRRLALRRTASADRSAGTPARRSATASRPGPSAATAPAARRTYKRSAGVLRRCPCHPLPLRSALRLPQGALVDMCAMLRLLSWSGRHTQRLAGGHLRSAQEGVLFSSRCRARPRPGRSQPLLTRAGAGAFWPANLRAWPGIAHELSISPFTQDTIGLRLEVQHPTLGVLIVTHCVSHKRASRQRWDRDTTLY